MQKLITPPPPPPSNPQYQDMSRQQTVVNSVVYTTQQTYPAQQMYIPQQAYPPQQVYFPQQVYPPNQQLIYSQPTLVSAPSSQPMMMNQISLITDPNAITVPMLAMTTNVIDINEVKRREQQEREEKEEQQLEIALALAESVHKSNVISNTYLFFMGLKVITQFMFMLFMIVSLIFYILRPQYKIVKEGNKSYLKSVTPSVSHSNYECTELKNDQAQSVINHADLWVFICAGLIIAYKIFYIYYSTKSFKRLFKQKYITKSEKFDISYLDYINLFFDYAFVISLSPLTAVVYEDCANLRYGIYTFGVTPIYVAGVIFSIFNFICLGAIVHFFRAQSFDKLMLYPFLVLLTLPAIVILIFISCGISILSQKVNYYKITTTYSDGSKSVSHTDDDARWLVIFPIICVIVVIVFFCIMIIISFALIFVFCHPAMIVYYVLTILLSIGFLIANRKGTDYRFQLLSLYIFDYVRQTKPELLKQEYGFEFDNQNIKNPKLLQQLEQQSRTAYKDNLEILYKQNIRQTCQLYNQYKVFYAGLLYRISKYPVDRKEEPPKEVYQTSQPDCEQAKQYETRQDGAQELPRNEVVEEQVQAEIVQTVNEVEVNQEAENNRESSEIESEVTEKENENTDEPRNRKIRRELY